MSDVADIMGLAPQAAPAAGPPIPGVMSKKRKASQGPDEANKKKRGASRLSLSSPALAPRPSTSTIAALTALS